MKMLILIAILIIVFMTIPSQTVNGFVLGASQMVHTSDLANPIGPATDVENDKFVVYLVVGAIVVLFYFLSGGKL